MKVLHVLSHFLPRHIAGTEVYVWSLIKHLSSKEISSLVCIPNYGNGQTEKYIFDGIQVIRFGENSKVDRQLIMGRRLPSGIENFKLILDSEKPDIVHFHELSGSNGITIDHIRIAKSKSVKIIMTFHLSIYSCKTGKMMYKGKDYCGGKMVVEKCSTCYLHDKGYAQIEPILVFVSGLMHKLGIRPDYWNSKAGTALGTFSLVSDVHNKFIELISLCDRVVSLSAWYQQVLIRNGVHPSKIQLIAQGLPHDFVVRQSGTNLSITLPIKLLYVGRISKQKGLDILIRAIKNFSSDQVVLDIYGQEMDNAYASLCRALSKDLPNIRWRGAINPEKVVEVMSAYDFLCLCSATCEMAPLVIQEAFAAGIPVIASNIFGNAEQIRDGENGLLFEFMNTDSLRNVIERIVENPFIKEKLSRQISPPHNFKAVAADHILLYKELISLNG